MGCGRQRKLELEPGFPNALTPNPEKLLCIAGLGFLECRIRPYGNDKRSDRWSELCFTEFGDHVFANVRKVLGSNRRWNL